LIDQDTVNNYSGEQTKSMKISFPIVFTLFSALTLTMSPPAPVSAEVDQAGQTRKELYHQGWIDLNKNGRMDNLCPRISDDEIKTTATSPKRH